MINVSGNNFLIKKNREKDKRCHISQFQLVRYEGLKALPLKALCRRIPLVGRWKKVGLPMLVYMSTHFRPGARTAGPIETGECWFDAPERRKDDGAC